MRVSFAAAVTLVLLASACGGGGGGRLSAAEYRAHLQTIGRESNAVQHAVEKGFRTTSVPQLVKVLRAFRTAESRIGNQVAAPKAPKDAEAANAELAKGQRDTASEVQTILPKIRKMPSAKTAIAYLSNAPTTKGGHEVDQALAKLKQLGYIKNVS